MTKSGRSLRERLVPLTGSGVLSGSRLRRYSRRRSLTDAFLRLSFPSAFRRGPSARLLNARPPAHALFFAAARFRWPFFAGLARGRLRARPPDRFLLLALGQLLALRLGADQVEQLLAVGVRVLLRLELVAQIFDQRHGHLGL